MLELRQYEDPRHEIAAGPIDTLLCKSINQRKTVQKEAVTGR